MSEEKIKFTVVRDWWDRGPNSQGELLADDGKMCCLGFLAESIGADDSDIANVATPQDCPEVKWPDGLLTPLDKGPLDDDALDDESVALSVVCAEIIQMNDAPIGYKDITDEPTREAELKKLFANIGIEVEFVDFGETEEDHAQTQE